MPVGAQCVSRMPISWPWNTGRPWWPDWVIERDRRAFEVGAEVLERVEVRVRAEQAHVAALHELVEPLLELLARPCPVSEKPAAKITANFALRCSTSSNVSTARPVRMIARSRSPGTSNDRRVALVRRAPSRTRGAPGRTSRRAASAHASNLRVIAVFGLRRLLGRADHRDRLRVQERVEVDVAQRERAAGDVDVDRASTVTSAWACGVRVSRP